MVGLICLRVLRSGNEQKDMTPEFDLILPNRDHGYRQLSPMLLGPVKTGETDFPVAKRLENFWQYSKVFKRDLEADGTVGEKYFAAKRKGYADSQGHRHKYARWDVPLYTCFYNGTKEERYQYIESRKFYCNHYEYLARQKPEYGELFRKLETRNLMIKGFDGCTINSNTPDLQGELNWHYTDPSHPFGHEKVLFCLLCLDKGLIKTRPWPLMNLVHRYILSAQLPLD